MRLTIDDVSFQDVGVLDRTQLARSLASHLADVCPAEAPAVDVVAMAAARRLPLILVTADPSRPPERYQGLQTVSIPELGERVVCGLVEPWNLRTRLLSHFSTAHTQLLDILRDYEQSDAEQKNWRHEWLNRDSPVLQWCGQGGGHLTVLPCRYHASSASALW